MLLSVQDMTCGHCVKAVTAAVQAISPGAEVEVDLAAGTVRITGCTDPEAAQRAIEDAGYPASLVES
jgi:copper chaperone